MQITQSLDFDSDRAPSADSIIAITFRDPDLYQLQRAKAADWNVLLRGRGCKPGGISRPYVQIIAC